MTQASTRFTSRDHGFRFINLFQFSFKVDLPLVRTVDLGDVVYGLCGGMCFAALDCFHAGTPVPNQPRVPRVGTPLYVCLVDRQVDSLSLPGGLLRVLEWMILDDREVGRRTAVEEFPKLRARIDGGEPASLCLIRQRGISDPGHNHQVVARAYMFDETNKRAEIPLYDPNHPGAEPNLTMDLSDPGGRIALAQSSGEGLRGFFLMDYRRERPPAP
jgi:hypothetical protein